MYKVLFFTAVISIVHNSVHCDDMGDAQMKKAAEMVRQVCQPKFKVPDAAFENFAASGVIPNDKDFKCFLHCSLELMGMMKRNKVLYDAARKQMETLLPENQKGPWLNAIDICQKKVEIVKNGCETAYNMMTCFKENNPSFSI